MMDTLAEGWEFFTKKDIELLSIYNTLPPNERDQITLPFTKIETYQMVLGMMPDHVHHRWLGTRRKLIAMWCNDYVTLYAMREQDEKAKSGTK